MGTHPIFESDFDCLTVFRMAVHMRKNSNNRATPYQASISNIPELKQFLTGIKPRLLLRNIPKDSTQSELLSLMPVAASEIKAMEFLKKSDATYSGACVIEL